MLILRHHESDYSVYPRPHARQWPLYAQFRERAWARRILGVQEQDGREVRKASVMPYCDRHPKGKPFAWKDSNALRTVQSGRSEAAGTKYAAELTSKAKASEILVGNTAPQVQAGLQSRRTRGTKHQSRTAPRSCSCVQEISEGRSNRKAGKRMVVRPEGKRPKAWSSLWHVVLGERRHAQSAT